MNGEGASRSGRSWSRPHSSNHARRRVFGVFTAGPLRADAACLTGILSRKTCFEGGRFSAAAAGCRVLRTGETTHFR